MNTVAVPNLAVLDPPTLRLWTAVGALDAVAAAAALAEGANVWALDKALTDGGRSGLLHAAIDAYSLFEERLGQSWAEEQARAGVSDGSAVPPALWKNAIEDPKRHVQRVVHILLRLRPVVPVSILNKGLTPLLAAAEAGLPKCVIALAKAGADVEARTPFGFTAAHLAALRAHRDVLRTLHTLGASMDRPDQEKRTPAHLAARQQHVAVLRDLRRYGVRMTAQNIRGHTAIQELAQGDGSAGLAKDWLAWERRYEAHGHAAQLEQSLPSPPRISHNTRQRF